MTVTTAPESPTLRSRTWLTRLALAWGMILLLVVGQRLLHNALEGRPPDSIYLIRWRVLPVLLWGAFTPVVVKLARRWPVRALRDVHRTLLHAVVAGAWIVLSNMMLRIPDLVSGVGASTFLEATASAAIRHAPAGTALYAVLLVVFQGLRARATEDDDTRPEEPDPFAEQLALREGDRVYLVAPDDVLWIEADGDHVLVHAAERSYRVRGTLKSFARRLRPRGFLRVHRSHVVNLAHVREFQPYHHGDYVAVLDDGTAVRVPRSREDVVDRLRGLFRKEPASDD